MKIERPTFPVVITLETQEELDILLKHIEKLKTRFCCSDLIHQIYKKLKVYN